ncbi:beta-lactamase regulating signal transducer with metallopeptidase domain [Paucibacter oligotrophus]|uniref:Beta-lactamase regulating signal transducer with metallopeptidase domain n=1 Tax=Roseateles oligotrophus TaxID=1769250 RepID=A0A840LBD9_9BURK|nr:M56 family metallopeptidase [Roseateles oligotrophus]MBB4845466.1 beta-lactamase regulating signal transducer with metallopeptidase domain [Roseateles oligotrophus]
MIESLFTLLLRQSLLLSLGVILVLALRPWLLRLAGPDAARKSWALLPLLLLSTCLPRPAQEPVQVFWGSAAQGSEGMAAAVLGRLPASAGNSELLLLSLWAAGAVLVTAMQWRRQRAVNQQLIWPKPGSRARASKLARLPAGASPALIGVWPGRIALPQDFEQRFTPAERRLILAHELQHQRRCDNAWNLLACLLCCLHWFNPLAWLAWRRLRHDQELACDAAVLQRRPTQRAAYAKALLAAQGLRPMLAPGSCSWMLPTTHPLIERIAMLKTHAPHSALRRHASQGLLGLLLLSGLGGAYLAQAEPAPDKQLVELKLTMSFNGEKVAQPRLITALNVPATVEWDQGDANGAWRIVTTVTQEPSGDLRIHSRFSDGRPLQAHTGWHTQIGAAGQLMQMQVTSAAQGPALALERVVNLIPASALKPQP